jgi:hypothetical protein
MRCCDALPLSPVQCARRTGAVRSRSLFAEPLLVDDREDINLVRRGARDSDTAMPLAASVVGSSGATLLPPNHGRGGAFPAARDAAGGDDIDAATDVDDAIGGGIVGAFSSGAHCFLMSATTPVLMK